MRRQSGERTVKSINCWTMLLHELSTDQCEEILQRSDLGRLACAVDDQPYVVPIHFSYDLAANCLYAFSLVGQKIEWMRRNPKVCVEVEHVVDKNHWTTVLAFGRFEELNDSSADTVSRTSALELFERRYEWWLPAAAKLPSRERHAMVVYRIQIHRLTGRRASRGSQIV